MHRATPVNSSFRGYVAGGARATVNTIDDSQLMQEHASDFMKNESRSAIESPQNYGFTSVAAKATMDAMGKIIGSAETFISFMGGNRSFPVAGNMDDRRHRLFGLSEGDTAMYRQKDDKQQFHMTSDGGFWSAPQDKTMRMALLDENSGSQQQQGGGSRGTPSTQDGSGGAGGSGTSGGQQQMGQTSVKDSNQKAGKFIDITKEATRAAGKIVQLIVAAASGGGGGSGKDGSSSGGSSSGTVLAEANGSNFYCGGTPGQGQFAMIVTVKGPTMNVPGRIG
jgi:phage gp45-like